MGLAEGRAERAKDPVARDAAKAEIELLEAQHQGNTLRLAHQLEQLTGLEARISILGYIQRGGTPSPVDRLLATRLGSAAADLVMAGTFGVMVAARGDETAAVPLEQVAGQRKRVPAEHPWVAAARHVGTCLGRLTASGCRRGRQGLRESRIPRAQVLHIRDRGWRSSKPRGAGHEPAPPSIGVLPHARVDHPPHRHHRRPRRRRGRLPARHHVEHRRAPAAPSSSTPASRSSGSSSRSCSSSCSSACCSLRVRRPAARAGADPAGAARLGPGYGPTGDPNDPRRQWVADAHRRLHEEDARGSGTTPAHRTRRPRRRPADHPLPATPGGYPRPASRRFRSVPCARSSSSRTSRRSPSLVRDYLEHAGFAVLTAGDGAGGLALARARRPDAARPRPRPAPRRRPRRRPQPPPRLRGPDRDPHGPRRRGRPDHRPRAGRRRLRGQAVQPQGAGRAGAGGAPPGRGAAGVRRADRRGRPRARPRPTPGHGGGPRGPAHPDRVRAPGDARPRAGTRLDAIAAARRRARLLARDVRAGDRRPHPQPAPEAGGRDEATAAYVRTVHGVGYALEEPAG